MTLKFLMVHSAFLLFFDCMVSITVYYLLILVFIYWCTNFAVLYVVGVCVSSYLCNFCW